MLRFKLASGTLGLVLLAATSACDGTSSACGPGEVGCLSATFTVVGQTEFPFAQPATLSRTSTTWSLFASDPDRRYTIHLFFAQSTVTQPGEYSAALGLNRLGLMIGRPHPTQPSSMRFSSTSGGTVRFTSVGYTAGALIEGTFDGVELIRTAPDDQIHIKLSQGTFSASVP